MNNERQPRAGLYDGPIYGHVIDPLLAGLRRIVIEQLGDADPVLDACCGTGALALRLGELGKQVRGVDLSPRNIAFAQRRLKQSALENVDFEVGDVAHLSDTPDKAFAAATIVMALHEMPGAFRLNVLREIARVSERVLVLDYAVPMPKNVAGWRNRAIELAAGWQHFSAFRDFSKNGGLAPLVEAAGLKVERKRALDSDTLFLWELVR